MVMVNYKLIYNKISFVHEFKQKKKNNKLNNYLVFGVTADTPRHLEGIFLLVISFFTIL